VAEEMALWVLGRIFNAVRLNRGTKQLEKGLPGDAARPMLDLGRSLISRQPIAKTLTS
jgi:hypothetical protein